MSVQSLLSTHNYGSRYRRGDDSMNYSNSSSGPGAVDFLEHPGRTSSTRYVRSRQAEYRHVLMSYIGRRFP